MRSQIVWVFFSLSGRLSPAAGLLSGLFLAVVQFFFFYQLLRVPLGTPASSFWETLFTVAVIVGVWCNFALTAKRFHDFDKPTAFGAISLIAGPLLYVVLAFIKSTPGANRFGPTTNAPA